MTPEAILADLVACPDLPGRSNATIAETVQRHLRRMGVEPVVLQGPEGDRVNILATIGPRDVPGVVLSGHMDVVATDGQVWASDPFCLTARDGRLYGRGTTDMKGFLACMLAMVPEFQAAGLRQPIHLAFSYDEEIGCRGVGHMIAAMPGLIAPPLACIVGEPSAMRPVLSHKGKRATSLVLTGRAAHSSRPEAGLNANYAGAEMLLAIRDLNARLAEDGPFDDRFSPPHSTVVAGVVRGGTAVNIIPERCEIAFEVRAIPADDPAAITAKVIRRAQDLVPNRALAVSHSELSAYPALPPSECAELADLLARLTGNIPLQSVSYGTEAGLFQAAGIPAIICGPGEIDRAHRPDEFITPGELAECCAMLRGLAQHLSSA
ncbi:acetylornithine deacetylase [Paracoccus sp. MBLB3053]|uniref:Acetylornithine deacetylase n=1 Tax=Paracoccus aurantius TaxID=3073814 RepID=A0ABU2HZE5_9RHOB|nr:acetylornithine deacetylase [Paracoccus sp. MBLB3053]MDS9469925.1 acetylornithine deacetylase [Paracoccus sp. MBLB3053]